MPSEKRNSVVEVWKKEKLLSHSKDGLGNHPFMLELRSKELRELSAPKNQRGARSPFRAMRAGIAKVDLGGEPKTTLE